MQAALQGYMAGVRRYQQQLQMVTSNGAGTHKEITKQFPSQLSL